MKIAFIHYHLKTGGVTTVLRQQVEAIQNACEVLVLTGTPPESPFPADTIHIPGIGYDTEDTKPYDPEKVAELIVEAIFSRWNDGCDVLHVHNPTLAKNRNFLKILKAIQKKNIKLFLQIHDFAEDGRPLSYFYDDDYVPDCHYGAINSRDYNILLKSGLKKEGLHKIFNTISPFNFKGKNPGPKGHVLYPIRAIRRKNIGEAILLSLFFKNKEALFITLPPNSPADIVSYEGWKEFVNEKNLHVVFEAGLTNKFSTLVRSARFLITTSITEGFGFSFLEPWTAQKVLWGRRLPDICYDFDKKGIYLDHLYSRLLVPIKWIGKKMFYEKWKSCILESCARFNYDIDEGCIEKSFETITENENIDFGLLDETFQKQIISRVLSSKKDADRLIRRNPYLSNPGYVLNKEGLIQNNEKAVLNNYNKNIYKKKLLEIYARVVKDSVCHSIDKTLLLSEFFNLKQFSLLKWSEYE